MGTIPDDAVRQIFSGHVESATFSPDGSKIYAVSGTAVRAIDRASGQVVASYDLGEPLGPLDVSPDGRYLVAAAYPTPLYPPVPEGPGRIYRIDTQTGLSADYVTERAVSDVAFLNDGGALVSYRGNAFLDRIDFATGIIAGDFNFQTFESALLDPSPDHSHVLVMDTSIFARAYDFQAGTGLIGGYAGNGSDPYAGPSVPDSSSPFGAISPNNRVIVHDGKILDERMNLLGTVPNGYSASGAAFSPVGDKLYISVGQTVLAVETTNWTPIAAYTLDASTSDYFAIPRMTGFGDILQISRDGRYLSAITTTGLQIVDLSLFPAGGTQNDDVLTDTGFLFGLGGNDTLGGPGDQTMYGGLGNDTYLVDSPYDRIEERAGEGADRVFTTVSLTIPDNVEDMTFTGTSTNMG